MFAVVLLYLVQSYFTIKNNQIGSKWFWFLTVSSMIPCWAIVSRFSKNVVVDAIIYDVLLTVSYAIGILYFSNTFERLKVINLCGIILIIVGLLLFKRGLG